MHVQYKICVLFIFQVIYVQSILTSMKCSVICRHVCRLFVSYYAFQDGGPILITLCLSQGSFSAAQMNPKSTPSNITYFFIKNVNKVVFVIFLILCNLKILSQMGFKTVYLLSKVFGITCFEPNFLRTVFDLTRLTDFNMFRTKRRVRRFVPVSCMGNLYFYNIKNSGTGTIRLFLEDIDLWNANSTLFHQHQK